MDELIKIKGLKGKQNKKKWAKNIDVSGLLDAKAREHDEQLRLQFQQPLLIEDLAQKKRIAVDPHRFQSKGESLPKPVYNNRITRQSVFADELQDQWSKEPTTKIVYKKSSIPAVIAPLSGHSYNPQEQDIQEIIEKVVEHEGPQQQQIKEKKQKPIRNVVPRARNKNRRLEQLQAKQRREQRSLNNSIHNLKHLQRLQEAQDEKNEQKRKTKQIQKETREKQKLTGRVLHAPRLGKEIYRYREYIPSADEINLKLSYTAGSEHLVKQHYDSIFRRGILEQRNIKVHANKRKNIKVIEKYSE